MAQKSIPELISDDLVAVGVRDVFCVVGGAITPLVSHLSRDERIRMHYMFFEQSAGIAAEAYGFTNGVPACLLVTSGPGATNAMTPVAAAWTSSTPLIVISGQVRTADIDAAGANRQWGSQHLNVSPMVSGIVKDFYSLRTHDAVCRLPQVLRAATSPRTGPVWVEVPLDVQRQSVDMEIMDELVSTAGLRAPIDIDWAWLLDGVERPLFLLGNGARGHDGEAVELARRLGWPVQLTWPALDFLTCEDPLYAGRPGSISTWAANLTIQSADLVVMVGARLDWGQIAFNPTEFCPNAKVVRVDVDPDEFRRIPDRANWLNIEADAGEFISAVRASLDAQLLRSPDVEQWRQQVHAWQVELSAFGDPTATFSGISMYALLEQLHSASARFRTVVTGSSGTCAEQTMQAIRPVAGQRILNSGGLGSMGFPIAGAIGAHYATDGTVLCLESDGSFWMNPQDLAYISTHQLPIVCVFLDSDGYKSLRLSHERGGYQVAGSDTKSGLMLPSIEDFALSLGLPTTVVTAADDWKRMLRDELASGGRPKVVVVKVDRSEEALPRTVSRVGENGQMVTARLQDLWPALTPSERQAHWPSHLLG